MATDTQTVLVTGAGGFVGGWVTEALYLSGLATVRAGIRSWAHAARIARFPVEITACDIMDPGQLTAAMDGVDLVVHCAVGDRRVTVDGTRNVLQHAHRAGVKRVVALSTAEVYGHVTGDVDETCPVQHTGNEYGDSKADAETECWEFARRGLEVVVLRPSIVYGPYSETWTIDLAARLGSGRWSTFEGYGNGICNLVYVDDLVSAAVIALTHPGAAGQAFNINGPDHVTWNEYFARFNGALGLPELNPAGSSRARWRSATSDLVRSSSRVVRDHLGEPIAEMRRQFDWAEATVQQLKRMVKTTPSTRELQNLYSRRAHYVPDKAERVLGFRPEVDLDAGLRMSVGWLEHCGLVQVEERVTA
jgi:nucleoside-diphosphate-sugar epimerase